MQVIILAVHRYKLDDLSSVTHVPIPHIPQLGWKGGGGSYIALKCQHLESVCWLFVE